MTVRIINLTLIEKRLLLLLFFFHQDYIMECSEHIYTCIYIFFYKNQDLFNEYVLWVAGCI